MCRPVAARHPLQGSCGLLSCAPLLTRSLAQLAKAAESDVLAMHRIDSAVSPNLREAYDMRAAKQPTALAQSPVEAQHGGTAPSMPGALELA